MKTKGVIGKRIVRVDQERCVGNYGQTVWHVSGIKLEDGSYISFDSTPLADSSGGLDAVVGTWVSKKETGGRT